MKTLVITNFGTEDFGGEQSVVSVTFKINQDEIYTAYLNADRTIDLDSFDCGGYDQDEVLPALQDLLDQEESQLYISKIISEVVFGSNDFVADKQLFGTWLNSWGIFKFFGSDGEVAVAVCHANDDVLRIDRKAKTFNSESEYLDWHEQMQQYDFDGNALIVSRAIDDIEGR